MVSDKSAVLGRYGPPNQSQHIEGDEFWYYVVQERNPFIEMGNVFSGFSAGMRGRTPMPTPPPQRILIFQFDGRTGALKNTFER